MREEMSDADLEGVIGGLSKAQARSAKKEVVTESAGRVATAAGGCAGGTCAPTASSKKSGWGS